MTRLFRPIAAVLLVVSVGGCQALANLTGSGESTPAQDPAQETVAHAPATAPASQGPQETLIVDSNPDQFLGLAGAVVADQLGAPDLVRRDGSAEVRQFRGDACVLDLFLYPEGDALLVKYVELRGANLDLAAREECLASMIRARILAG